MIRVEVIEQFTLKDYEKIKDTIKRKSIDVKGTLFIGDTFECDEDMVKYLTGNNEQGKVVVKVIEVEPIKIKKEFVKPLEKAPIEDALSEEATRAYLDDKPIKPKKKKTSKK